MNFAANTNHLGFHAGNSNLAETQRYSRTEALVDCLFVTRSNMSAVAELLNDHFTKTDSANKALIQQSCGQKVISIRGEENRKVVAICDGDVVTLEEFGNILKWHKTVFHKTHIPAQ